MSTPEPDSYFAHEQALRRIRQFVAKAARAPSIHNTQPWQFTSTPTTLTLHADRSRQLTVLDPTGRQLMISCGCALLNARVAAAAAGFAVGVTEFPDPSDLDLLARMELSAGGPADPRLAALDSAIHARATNRREFVEASVPPELVRDLRNAAAEEGVDLHEIAEPRERGILADLAREADSEQIGDPAYRAELRAWTTSDPFRRDGVSAMTVPHVDAGSSGELSMRDFDTHGRGILPKDTGATLQQCLVLLSTEADDPLAWLDAGQALERVLLGVTRAGFVASPLTQVVEVPAVRADLRSRLGMRSWPHVLLRIGRAAATAGTQRRLVEDVLVEGPETS